MEGQEKNIYFKKPREGQRGITSYIATKMMSFLLNETSCMTHHGHAAILRHTAKVLSDSIRVNGYLQEIMSTSFRIYLGNF